MARAKRCLCGECDGPQAKCGLSIACYTAARRAVTKGKVSWETLVEQGKALPPTPHGQRRKRNPMSVFVDGLAKSAGG